jgi:heme exporter protein A
MLEAHDLTARRGAAELFANLSLRVAPGEALLVVGANGRGKTTLLRMLAGLSLPAAGTLRWNAVPVAPFAPALRAAVAFVGHAPALKDDLTAGENLASLVALAGNPATPDALAAALEAVALTHRRDLPARALSQGQRRRIGLARLLLSRRPLWILDEPATALDPPGLALFADLARRHLDRGGLLIAASHVPLELPSARMRTLTLQ